MEHDAGVAPAPSRAQGPAGRRDRKGRAGDSGTIVYRFTLSPQDSCWLLGKSPRVRGELVRIDVEQLVRVRRGGSPLHEKGASMSDAEHEGGNSNSTPSASPPR